MALVNDKKLFTNVTRRFIVGVAEVFKTPLKLANIKSLKMSRSYNCKIMPAKKKKKLVKQCFRVDFPRINFSDDKIPEVSFRG